MVDMVMQNKGLTIIDLLAVIAIIAILVTLVVPAVQRAIELSNQASCRANLKGVGTGMAMFKGDDKNASFPLWTTGQPKSKIAWTDTAKDLDELKTKLIGRESAMQNVWVFIDKAFVTENAFGCPSDEDYVMREFADKADRRANKVGWRSCSEFSYGLHFPYESTTVDGKKVENPAYIGPYMKGSFPIMADRNVSQNDEPTTGADSDRPRPNHDDNLSVLMFSGAVNWKTGSDDSKFGDDDIYTIRKENNANLATPADQDDVYIVHHPWILWSTCPCCQEDESDQ